MVSRVDICFILIPYNLISKLHKAIKISDKNDWLTRDRNQPEFDPEGLCPFGWDHPDRPLWEGDFTECFLSIHFLILEIEIEIPLWQMWHTDSVRQCPKQWCPPVSKQWDPGIPAFLSCQPGGVCCYWPASLPSAGLSLQRPELHCPDAMWMRKRLHLPTASPAPIKPAALLLASSAGARSAQNLKAIFDSSQPLSLGTQPWAEHSVSSPLTFPWPGPSSGPSAPTPVQTSAHLTWALSSAP